MQGSTTSPASHEVPEPLRNDVRVLGEFLGRVLREAGGDDLLADVEHLRELAIRAHNGPDAGALAQAEELVAGFSLARAEEVARAFTCYFHLANTAEEFHRVRVLRDREANLLPHHLAPDDSLPSAVAQLADEVGEDVARQRLAELEFRPVFTAHPTEARRRAVSSAIRRIAELVAERDLRYTGGMSLAENDRRLLSEIDTLWRTAPLREAKPSVLDEVRTVINVFEATLADVLPAVYRRLDDWLLADAAGTTAPAVRSFARLGTWIGGDRDGNPNVTAEITETAAAMASEHALLELESSARKTAHGLTLDAVRHARLRRAERPVAASARPVRGAGRADRGRRPQRAAPSGRLLPGRAHRRDADAQRRPRRTARRRSSRPTSPSCSARWPRPARRGRPTATCSGSSGRCRPSGSTWPSSRCGSTPRCTRARSRTSRRTASTAPWSRARSRSSTRSAPSAPCSAATACCAARRYIVSFTQSAEHLAAVYQLAEIAFAGVDAPVIDAVPLFETFADLEASVDILEGALALPQVQRRLAENGRRVEVMLGYSDSSKDVGPVSATLDAGHRAAPHHGVGAPQRHRAHALPRPRWRPRARWRPRQPRAARAAPGVGRRPVQAHRAGRGHLRPLRRPGDRRAAHRAGRRGDAAGRGALGRAPQRRGHRAVHRARRAARRVVARRGSTSWCKAPGFPQWFAEVTPLEEVGLLPIGSRPARRGLSVESLDDLRAIPWVFSWSQARINLAGWYGLGTALAAVGDLDELREALRPVAAVHHDDRQRRDVAGQDRRAHRASGTWRSGTATTWRSWCSRRWR